MEELKIAIDCLMLKKSDLQLAIAKPFAYGRWPNDEEFSAITKDGIELLKIEAQIDAMKEVLDSIVCNNCAAIAAAKVEV